MSDVCIRISNVSKSYVTNAGTHLALNNVSLDVKAGEFLVLLGPSGCGKTTLLRAIAGLEELNAGTISYGDTVWSAPEQNLWLPPEDRHLGMVFQSYALWPHMNVFDNIAYPLRNLGTSKADITDKVQKALERMGLAKQVRAFPGQLSGGQQQRVALARALVSENPIILFDEPLSNLDAKVRARLRIELADLQQSLGFASIYVTHDQAEALALADRIAVMEVGRIAQIGTPEDIYDRPASRYVADFIGSANEVKGKVKDLSATQCTVETALGLFIGPRLAGVDAQGQNVAVMFRPEHCSIDELDGTSPNGITNSLSVEIAHQVFQGAIVEYVMQSASVRFIVSRNGTKRLTSGQQCHVAIPHDKTMIFPLPLDHSGA